MDVERCCAGSPMRLADSPARCSGAGGPHVTMHSWEWRQTLSRTDLFDTLFRLAPTESDWPCDADAFGPSLELNAHYTVPRLSPLSHKATFSLPRCRLKLCSASQCDVRVSGGTGWWYALVADCEITTAHTPQGDTVLWLPGCEPMQLDAHLLLGSGRRLDTRQLAGHGRWCVVASRSTLRLRLDGPASVLALSSETQCDLRLSQCLSLEYWTRPDDDWRLCAPARFTVTNAQWLLGLYASMHQIAHEQPADAQPSVRYLGQHASFSGDMASLAELVELRVHFMAHEAMPRFYRHQKLLSVRAYDERHLTVYSSGDEALADVVIERDSDVVLHFTLLYAEERRRGDPSLYYMYTL